MRYWPFASVTTERTFSMRTGLAASTITPGSTAPEESLTTPAMDDCADALAGKNSRKTATETPDSFASCHAVILFTDCPPPRAMRVGGLWRSRPPGSILGTHDSSAGKPVGGERPARRGTGVPGHQ